MVALDIYLQKHREKIMKAALKELKI